MKFKKISMCMLLAMSLHTNTLQANFFEENFGSFLFYASFITTWTFLKPKVQQKPINALKLDTIVKYQTQRHRLRGLISPSASNQTRERLENINDLAEAQFISTLQESVSNLQNNPRYKNKNAKIIKKADELASKAHAAVHEQARQERMQQANLDAQMQQIVTQALLRIIAEQRERNAQTAISLDRYKDPRCGS